MAFDNHRNDTLSMRVFNLNIVGLSWFDICVMCRVLGLSKYLHLTKLEFNCLGPLMLCWHKADCKLLVLFTNKRKSILRRLKKCLYFISTIEQKQHLEGSNVNCGFVSQIPKISHKYF